MRQEDVWSEGIVTLNGFPVDDWIGRGVDQRYDVPINTALVGEGNELYIEQEPMLKRVGGGLSVGSVEMRTWVTASDPVGTREKRMQGTEISSTKVDSAYGAWTRRAQKKWEAYLGEMSGPGEALDSIRAWADHNPMTVSTTFDNEHGPDFSEIFEEAPVIEGTPPDTARLKDYAMRLRDLLRAGDARGLYEELKPRMRRPGGLNPDSTERAIAKLKGSWLFTDTEVDFGREDVGLRRWSSGRVWELYVKPDHDFLYTASGSETEVYVAEIDGELKVVR